MSSKKWFAPVILGFMKNGRYHQYGWQISDLEGLKSEKCPILGIYFAWLHWASGWEKWVMISQFQTSTWPSTRIEIRNREFSKEKPRMRRMILPKYPSFKCYYLYSMIDIIWAYLFSLIWSSFQKIIDIEPIPKMEHRVVKLGISLVNKLVSSFLGSVIVLSKRFLNAINHVTMNSSKTQFWSTFITSNWIKIEFSISLKTDQKWVWVTWSSISKRNLGGSKVSLHAFTPRDSPPSHTLLDQNLDPCVGSFWSFSIKIFLNYGLVKKGRSFLLRKKWTVNFGLSYR